MVITCVCPISTLTLIPNSLIEKLCGATPTLATVICVGAFARTWNEFGLNLNSIASTVSAAAPDAGGACDSLGEGLSTAGDADATGDVEASAVGARLGVEEVGGST